MNAIESLFQGSILTELYTMYIDWNSNQQNQVNGQWHKNNGSTLSGLFFFVSTSSVNADIMLFVFLQRLAVWLC